MVNTGKPSGGCKLCRARRVKCDETKPFCLKCLKYGRQCPGYRDPFEVKIRDETQTTIRRLQKRPRGQPGQDFILQPVDDPQAGYYGSGQFPGPYGSMMPYGQQMVVAGPSSQGGNEENERDEYECLLSRMSYSREEQATCFFLSDFIMLPYGMGSRGYYRFVHTILSSGNCLPGFTAAFKAVSMAALSSRPGSQALLNDAQVWYSRALREANKAIQDPVLVRNDQTLATVLMLAFFEALAPRGSLSEYVNHMRGAAAIIRTRGPPKAEMTPEANEMYALARNHFFTLYIMPIDSNIDGGSYDFLAVPMPGQPAWPDRCAALNIACLKVRVAADILLKRWPAPPKRRMQRSRTETGEEQARSKEADAVETAHAEALLERGVALLVEVGRFFDSSPFPWKPEVIPVDRWIAAHGSPYLDDGSSLAFTGHDGPAHVYRYFTLRAGILTAMTWVTHIVASTSVLRIASALMRAKQAREMNEADEEAAKAAASGSGGGGDSGRIEKSLPSPAPSASSEPDDGSGATQPETWDYHRHPAFALARTVAQNRVRDVIAALPFFCTWTGSTTGNPWMSDPAMLSPPIAGSRRSPPSFPSQASPQNIQPQPQAPSHPQLQPGGPMPGAPGIRQLPHHDASAVAASGPGIPGAVPTQHQAHQQQQPGSSTTPPRVPFGPFHRFACGTDEGYVRPAPTQRPNGPRGAATVKGLAGMMILWPVFCAKASDFCTPEQHDYLKNRLEFLRDIVGIRQAGLLLASDDRKTPSTEISRDMAAMGW